jgi:hypothetical protein
LTFAQPLPPLGTFLTANPFPFSVSTQAIFAYVSTSLNPGWRPAQSNKLVRFDAIASVEARGKKVLVNGEVFLRLGSTGAALHWRDQIHSVRQTAPAQRAKAIEKIFQQSLDTAAIKRRWRQFQEQTTQLRLIANGLFVSLFLLAPAVCYRVGLRIGWPWLLAGVFTGMLGAAIFFRRASRSLYPSAGEEQFTHFLLVLLSPVTSIRALDLLSRPLLEHFHPVAVAQVFCDEEQFRRFARSLLLDLRHPALPICPRAEPEAREAEQFSRAAWLRAVETFLRRHELSPEELARPPEPADATCRAYCPRCLAQFTVGEGECPDCGGLALVAFDARASTGSRSAQTTRR